MTRNGRSANGRSGLCDSAIDGPRMIEEELFQVLSGAVSVLNTASVPLVGGHSAEGAELGVALTVTGNGSGRA